MKSLSYFVLAVLIVLTSSVPGFAAPSVAVNTFSCGDVVEIPQIECEALVALYNSTNGPGWTNNTNWLVTNSPSNWFGVIITSGHVQKIDLRDNKLVGQIPAEIGNLANLEILDLSNNLITGTIPLTIGNLTALTSLFLNYNQLSGNIPSQVGNLTNLEWLFLIGNQLNGPIPVEIGNLSNLWLLNMRNNKLSGNIPTEIGNLINLEYLYLDQNQLSGNIPTSLGNLNKLKYMLLYDNRLSGNIPPELGNLINLKDLWLENNQLEGNIPSTFINLVNLNDAGNPEDGLNFDYNMFNIPPGYPDPGDPLQEFLHQKDPDWQFYQGFEQLIGVGGGEIASLDGKTDILIPSGAVDGDTLITYSPHQGPSHDFYPLAFANNSFDLSAKDAIGNPITEFSLPITVTITFTDTDIVAPESSLGLYLWDDPSENWMDAVTTCPGGEYSRDPVANIFSLPICHMTEFGVFAIPLRQFLPMVRR